MRTRVIPVVILLALVALPWPALAGQPGARNFVAHLSGDEEVPPVDTQAQGQAIFQLNKAGEELRFLLLVANIEDINQAHIHCGAEGVNGPVVAFLYPPGPPPALIPGRSDGVLAQGTLTNVNVIPRPDSPQCPDGLADFDELLAKMRSGDTYTMSTPSIIQEARSAARLRLRDLQCNNRGTTYVVRKQEVHHGQSASLLRRGHGL